MNKKIQFEILKKCGVLSIRGEWKKELNQICWGKNMPKYDIRDWKDNHETMSKGVTLSVDELRTLRDLINKELESLEEEDYSFLDLDLDYIDCTK